VFWVISVYFNIRNTLPKSGTFLLGHSVYGGEICKTVTPPSADYDSRIFLAMTSKGQEGETISATLDKLQHCWPHAWSEKMIGRRKLHNEKMHNGTACKVLG